MMLTCFPVKAMHPDNDIMLLAKVLLPKHKYELHSKTQIEASIDWCHVTAIGMCPLKLWNLYRLESMTRRSLSQ